MAKTKVLILCGGVSEEHEISLISAKCIIDALDTSRFEPLVVGISKSGVWHLEETRNFYLGEFRADKIRLNETAPVATVAPFAFPDGRGRIYAVHREYVFDVVFPILHGRLGEDGTLQGLLELMDVPYVGSGCGGSWICMDKALSKQICKNWGIAVADMVVLESRTQWPSLRSQAEALGFPVFVKPSRQGSSVGISKVNEAGQLEAAVQFAFQYDSKVLIEKGISGREIECAVLGHNAAPVASLPGEIIPSSKVGWYSYEAKYLMQDGADTVAPAKLPKPIVDRIQDLAVKAFQRLECEGLARVDFFYNEKRDEVFLNEVNTLPGFTPISMYPKMWQASGLAYGDLITRLLELAQNRKKQPVLDEALPKRLRT